MVAGFASISKGTFRLSCCDTSVHAAAEKTTDDHPARQHGGLIADDLNEVRCMEVGLRQSLFSTLLLHFCAFAASQHDKAQRVSYVLQLFLSSGMFSLSLPPTSDLSLSVSLSLT